MVVPRNRDWGSTQGRGDCTCRAPHGQAWADWARWRASRGQAGLERVWVTVLSATPCSLPGPASDHIALGCGKWLETLQVCPRRIIGTRDTSTHMTYVCASAARTKHALAHVHSHACTRTHAHPGTVLAPRGAGSPPPAPPHESGSSPPPQAVPAAAGRPPQEGGGGLWDWTQSPLYSQPSSLTRQSPVLGQRFRPGPRWMRV